MLGCNTVVIAFKISDGDYYGLFQLSFVDKNSTDSTSQNNYWHSQMHISWTFFKTLVIFSLDIAVIWQIEGGFFSDEIQQLILSGQKS